jgi:hypothetical protein
MSKKTKKLPTPREFILLLFSTLVVFIIHHLNHVLRFLADAFASSTLDRLATRYASWYNLRLISSLLSFEGSLGKKKVLLKVSAQETLDGLMIVHLTHHNLEAKDVETYINSQLSIMARINHAGVNVVGEGEGKSKLIIPTMLN